MRPLELLTFGIACVMFLSALVLLIWMMFFFSPKDQDEKAQITDEEGR